ncbi:MAG: SAM-dependent methyltransferase [Bacteroidales bacterium]|nr:SAM-dependent methyltransferase [Bacteroidales bacterium]
MERGILYLIPVTLGSELFREVLPDGLLSVAGRLRSFIVEDIRSARRFLRLIDPTFPIDETHFMILNEHTKEDEIPLLLEPVISGRDTGILSEAGVPGVADPGSRIVALAHRKGITVKPMSGPSSLLLALMASGMNGQNFTFHGYLPVKPAERQEALRIIDRQAGSGTSQLFIETPYRNHKLLADILKYCDNNTSLCIAADLTLETEYVVTRRIKEWKGNMPDINKHPAVFILGREENHN